MNNITTTLADPDIIAWLVSLDAATVVLMLLLSIHYFVIAFQERRHGMNDRVLQGIVLVALMTGYIALELFWISMSRAAFLAGVVDPQFVSSMIRISVPSVGLVLAAWTVWWSSEVRRWQIVVGYAIAAGLFVYPAPYRAVAVFFYQLLAG